MALGLADLNSFLSDSEMWRRGIGHLIIKEAKGRLR
jgi:hypothetical protein